MNCKECDDINGDCDCEWMDIYTVTEEFKEFCGDFEHLKPYHNFRYFQCWGGGPEGGYIINDKSEIYEVNRTWFEPFKVEKVNEKFEIKVRHGAVQLRIIKN